MLAAIVLVVVERQLLENLLVLAAVIAALATARLAFRVHMELPGAQRPKHPVLFYNPKSGGGKAERFHLADEARRRGIEPIELKLGDDLEQLVRDAVKQGADGLAMAGGDGSQAIVAMIAAELDLPYACIPAGTRNHLALDLGVDRDDVVGALDAFVNGGERRVDLAEVNGQVFVNNVSLGLYADAVQRPGYREAKMHTILATVPEALGPDAEQPNPELGRTGGSGIRGRGSHLQQRLSPRPRAGIGHPAPTRPGAARGHGADADRRERQRLREAPARHAAVDRTDVRGQLRWARGSRDRRRGDAPRPTAAVPHPAASIARQDRTATSRRLTLGARARYRPGKPSKRSPDSHSTADQQTSPKSAEPRRRQVVSCDAAKS